ncbi:MAG: hypothetical protein M3P84_09105 [Chloroflexota bacterium]|nr:hypothetical protein [Chloroflexota bacterium]
MPRRIALIAALACSLALAALAAPASAHAPVGAATEFAHGSAADGSPVTLRGTLRLFHLDDFADGIGHDAYAIETATGTFGLDIHGHPPASWNGARVQARGTWANGLVRVALATQPSNLVRVSGAPRSKVRAIASADGQHVRLAAGTAAAAATKNVAVILFNFSDDSSQPYTPATAEAVVFDNGNAVASFFEEESRGAVTVSGDVFGWYPIAASKASCADPFGWASQARAAAVGAGVDLTAYTNVVYAFPFAASCAWAGMGEVHGPRSWNNGAFNLRVIAHELGHNFGVHHASSLSCTSAGSRVALSSTCVSSEYGDPFTVMGASSSAHDHATHLGQFGWLPVSEIRAVGPGGPYQLGSVLDGPAGSDRLLSIARGNGTWFYLDLRSVHGPYFDNFAGSAPAVNGVTIRISPNAPSPTWSVSQTQLVDTTPATATYSDAPLAVGQTLTDPVSGLRITALTAGSGVASVSVTDPIPPGAPGSLQATASGATTVGLTWTAATDNVGVDHYRVVRDGVDVGTPAGTSFSDSGRTPQTTYAYTVRAVDGSGNEGPSVTVGVTTPPAGTDLTPPTAPTSLKAKLMATTTKLYWTSAHDAFGVTGYKVYRVGVVKPIKTVTGKSVTVKRRSGARYYVRAFDAAGNLGPKSPTRRT